LDNASAAFQRAPDAPALPATPLRFIAWFVGKYRWWYLSMVLLEGINSTCTILIPYATGKIIKAVTQVAPLHGATTTQTLIDALTGPLWLFAALGIGEVIFSRAGGTCQIYVGVLQRHTVTRTLYAYLQHHSHRYLTNDFAGALAHRISETSLGVSQVLWSVIFDFWPTAITFAVAIVMLGSAHRELAELMGAWAVIFIGASFWLATRARPYAVKAAAMRSDTTGRVVDAVANLTSTRLFARLDFERKYLDEQLSRELRAVRTSSWYSERVRWFQYTAAALLKIGVVWLALHLWRTGQISVAEFVVAATTALLIINEARNLSRRFLEFFEYIGNVSNGVQTIVRPHEIIDSAQAAPMRLTRGGVEFRDVSFAYSLDQPIFRHMNVSIPAGQRVGLVGYSGSGKSTFVSLILRLYDPQSGAVQVDGVDIRSLTQESLHAQLSLIPQDPSLFHRSLLDNIRYGRLDASDEEVVEAARKAHAHEFIRQIRDQYAALVGERGVKLSGGQRQRIAIARVILKNAPILILDEATSSLDSVTEQAIQQTLEEVMKGKTVIVVAHRLSTIAHLDRILVFDQGRIVEDGSHAELLSLGGVYQRLWSRQAGGFLLDGASADTTDAEKDSVPTEIPGENEPPEEVIGHDRSRSKVL